MLFVIVDEKYFDLLNKPEDFERIFKEEDEEEKNDATYDKFDTNIKPNNNSDGDTSEDEDGKNNIEKKEKVFRFLYLLLLFL